MNPPLSEVLEAHGGLERWRQFTTRRPPSSPPASSGASKASSRMPSPRRMTVDLHREWGSVDPFGDPDWLTDFTPDRIAIVARDGTTIAERSDPRAAFTGHTLTTPWDPLHRAYFNGYALWTYLTTPFLLAEPKCEVAEIVPLREGDETWRGPSDVPGPHRHSQPRAGLLLRVRRTAPPPRLPGGRGRWFRCGAAGLAICRGAGTTLSHPTACLPARCRPAPEARPPTVSIDLTDFARR